RDSCYGGPRRERRRDSDCGRTRGEPMHRMCHPVVVLGLILALTTLPGRPAAADLIRPNASPSYPDIASDVNGVQNFTFHPETQTGVFTVTNTPYLLVGGPSVADEFAILPNSDGVSRQAVSLTLDSSGKLLDDPGNSYELY